MQIINLAVALIKKSFMPKEIKAPSEFMELVNGFRISRIILSAYELEIFTLLNNQSMTSVELALLTEMDPRSTDRFLNALVSIGLLTKTTGQFSNTPFTSQFLIKGEPSYLAGLSHQVHLWKTWSTLTEAIKAGTSVAVEEPIGHRSEDWLESFIAAMHSRGVPQSKEVADLIDFPGTQTILDVGGGSGAFAFEFIRRCKDAKAVIFDLPAVVPITQKYILRAHLTSSVETMAGDYLLDEFGGDYDLILVSAVIHINSPEENLLLIKKCANALKPSGQLIILDHFMNEERTEPQAGAIFALNMLVGTLHGDTYTEKEVRCWMLDAGLRNIHRKNTLQGTSLMIGRK
jgi:3-hydroxy-5-methyl-1-naphthoate 3-O-methyltransferase